MTPFIAETCNLWEVRYVAVNRCLEAWKDVFGFESRTDPSSLVVVSVIRANGSSRFFTSSRGALSFRPIITSLTNPM